MSITDLFFLVAGGHQDFHVAVSGDIPHLRRPGNPEIKTGLKIDGALVKSKTTKFLRRR